MVVRHALEHVFEVGVGLDVVEPCRGDEGADRWPSLQMDLSRKAAHRLIIRVKTSAKVN